MPDRLAASLLSPAGLAYGVIMKFRNNLYDQGIFKAWRSPIPVVSIGNITTGGTGKTPLVDWIVRFYRENGIAPAIISRGYG
ncbi:MAG: tetraacyldisaccharide 4'-kinase, partial [Chlorobiales bacterium]|nr:tetraacyldisaccharide 4'-kinase [Chlorobiales bacterium]